MGTGPELTTRIDALDGVTGIVLSGELDIATAPKLPRSADRVERVGTKAIVLDVRDLREGGAERHV
jgi:anti-anti-sigma regulatory factor